MDYPKITIYKTSLIVATLLSLLGSYFKITHYAYGNLILVIGMIISLGFIIPGLADVFGNNRLKSHEKLMWIVGFIFLTWIAGFLYFPKFKSSTTDTTP